MNSVIITGAGGFIGSHLSAYLAENGYEVYAISNVGINNNTYLRSSDKIHVIENSLDFDIIEHLPRNTDAFLHFAWEGVAPESRDQFEKQIQNVNLATIAVRIASAIKSKKFIFPGSTLEYIYYGKPINEYAIPSPPNAYGVAKISARYACGVLCKELDLPFVYTVISGVYSEDRQDNNVIHYTIDKLIRGEKPVYTSLEQLWDYVHIDDVVMGLKKIIEKGKSDTFYTLGHGDNWPLKNYIFQIRDIIDPKLPLGIGEIPYANGIMPCSCVDLSNLTKDTDYIPKIPFKEGILRVINRVKEKY